MNKNPISFFLLLIAFAISFFVFTRSIDVQEAWRIVASGIGMISFLGLAITAVIQHKKSKIQ